MFKIFIISFHLLQLIVWCSTEQR